MAIPEDDHDLQRAWQDTLQAFAKTAKIELRLNTVLKPEDVLAQLKSKRDKEDTDSAKYAVVKDILGKSLACIQTLGGMAAQGASMVFGPANLCFNAISYLITTGQNYSNIFSSLTELFKQVSDILERFVIYLKMKEVDLPLRKIVHELLQSIVSICALSVKVLHGNKILKFLRVFAFNEDDGVKGELLWLRKLVERESQMKTTLTYQITKEGFAETTEAISDVQDTVNKLADDSRKRDLESTETRQMDKIKSVLGIQNEMDKQNQLHTRLRSETVEGTGRWLLEESSYKAWSDRSQPFDKLILLSANEGFGKTFLLSSAVQNLQRRYAKQLDSTTRTTVAYYYLLPKDAKSAHGQTDNYFSVDKVVKTLALQLAQDPVYRKELSSLCDNWVEPENHEDLVTKLLHPCYKSTEVFYLVVDGIDQADDKQLAGLDGVLKHINARFDASHKTHVRILFSGRVEVVQSFAAGLNYPCAIVDVAFKNRPDLEIFIRDRLMSLKLLQGDTEQMRKLREEVFNNLSDSAHGDFVNVDLLLKEIGTKQWPAEIREVLATARTGVRRSDTIGREVTRCNESLSSQEIRDLNTLLLWVMSAKRTLQIKELDTALFLENKETSLRPLHMQIREKYSAFFHVDEAENPEGADGFWVSLSSDSIHTYFKDRLRPDSETVSKSGKIQEVEVKIIRRFLSSVCDQDLYTKFEFDDFFAQKLNSAAAFINVNLDRSAVALLLGCLEAITSSAKEAEALVSYAVGHWPIHLADVDLPMANPLDKITVGKQLISMFTDENIMPKWWISPSILSKDGWFFTDEPIDAVLTWLRDSAVTKSYTEEQKAWVKTLTSNTSPDADVLEYIAKWLAKMLFTDSTWDVTAVYSAVQAFRTKIKHRKDTSVVRIHKELSKVDAVSCDQINELSAWAANINQIETSQHYQWNRCLARALRIYGCYGEAAKQYKFAATLTEDNWYAQWGLSSVYRDQQQWQASIDLTSEVYEKILSGQAKGDDPRGSIRTIRYVLAQNHQELKRYDEALKYYDAELAESPADYWFLVMKMQVFGAQENYQAVVDLLEELHSKMDPSHGISQLGRLVHTQWLVVDEFENLMAKAHKRTNTRQKLVAIYNKAVEDTSNPSYLVEYPGVKATWRVLLTYAMSEEMWKMARTKEEMNDVIELWERLIPDASDAGLAPIKPYIGKRLATFYLDQMRQYAPESKEAAILMQKLVSLATEDSADTGAWESTINTNLLLARWNRLLGNEEDAMTLAKGTVKVALDLLSDEDADNDWQGYYRLGTALMYFGDVDGALAAWSLIGPPDRKEHAEANEDVPLDNAAHGHQNGKAIATSANGNADTEGDELDTEDDEPDGAAQQVSGTAIEGSTDESGGEAVTGIGIACDGDCGRGWTYADDIYVCMDCLDVAFNGPCLKLLRTGELPINTCNPKHEFLHIEPWDNEEADSRGKDHVRLRGRSVPVAQWLTDLKKTWGLEG